MTLAPPDPAPASPPTLARERVSLADDPLGWLEAAPRWLESCRRCPGTRDLQVGWRPAADGLHFRPLGATEAESLVRPLAQAVQFLPKQSWKTDHVPMLLHGLEKGRWHGTGLVDRAGRLVSYLDHCWREDGHAEIGFCMTHPDHRGRHLMTRLLTHLMLRNFAYDFRVSTHQHNQAMLAALRHFGFRVKEARLGERINGEASLYLRRSADTPFDLATAPEDWR